MLDSFKNWLTIIISPKQGFEKLNEKSNFVLIILTLIVLAIFAKALVLPVYTHDLYYEAAGRSYVNFLEMMGNKLTEAQKESEASMMQSDFSKQLTIWGTFLTPIISILVSLFIISFILWFTLKIFKTYLTFKLVFKILACSSIFILVENIIEALVLLSLDWKTILTTINNFVELKAGLIPPLSLAAFFNVESVTQFGYFVIDYLTNIFIYMSFIYVYYGLMVSGKIDHKKALSITITFAVFMLMFGMLADVFIPK